MRSCSIISAIVVVVVVVVVVVAAAAAAAAAAAVIDQFVIMGDIVNVVVAMAFPALHARYAIHHSIFFTKLFNPQNPQNSEPVRLGSICDAQFGGKFSATPSR